MERVRVDRLQPNQCKKEQEVQSENSAGDRGSE
jgi:hypothetical protein